MGNTSKSCYDTSEEHFFPHISSIDVRKIIHVDQLKIGQRYPLSKITTIILPNAEICCYVEILYDLTHFRYVVLPEFEYPRLDYGDGDYAIQFRSAGSIVVWKLVIEEVDGKETLKEEVQLFSASL